MKVRKQAASLVGKTVGPGKAFLGKKNAGEEVKTEEASGEGNKRKGDGYISSDQPISTGEDLAVGQRSIKETRRRHVGCKECSFRQYELALMLSVELKKHDSITTPISTSITTQSTTMTMDSAP
jgi:hypothetical protein